MFALMCGSPWRCGVVGCVMLAREEGVLELSALCARQQGSCLKCVTNRWLDQL